MQDERAVRENGEGVPTAWLEVPLQETGGPEGQCRRDHPVSEPDQKQPTRGFSAGTWPVERQLERITMTNHLGGRASVIS